jgi:hypothetical protein
MISETFNHDACVIQINLFLARISQLTEAINKARRILCKPGTDDDADRWAAVHVLEEVLDLYSGQPNKEMP